LYYSIKKTGQISPEKRLVEQGFENNLYKYIELIVNLLKKKNIKHKRKT